MFVHSFCFLKFDIGTILAANDSPVEMLPFHFLVKNCLYSFHVSKKCKQLKHVIEIAFPFHISIDSPEDKYWSHIITALEQCFSLKLNNTILPGPL